MDKKRTRLAEIVGKDAVLDNPDPGESFIQPGNQIPAMKSRFLVKPKTVDDVQQIVLWANENSTPLIPISSGPPHFHGDTVPTAPETVLIDLSGMDRILKIDRRNRLALIEPGVTYGQLQGELQKEGLRIAMPLLPRWNKSVITSLLEREPITSPKYQWNLLEPLRALEIIWGNGDKIWSGGGAFRGEKEEDWKQGLVPLTVAGPGQLDFCKIVSAAQGSMGIVTWASVKCEVYPDQRKFVFIPGEKLEDLIDCTYSLLKCRFGDELFIMNNTCMAHVLSEVSDELVAIKENLPSWTLVIGITGGQILSREKVEYQESDISDIARQFGLRISTELGSSSSGDFQELILKPSEEPYWKLKYRGGAEEVFFLTPLNNSPAFLETMYSSAEELHYPGTDIGVYIQPVHQGVGCHCEFILPVNREDCVETARMQKLFSTASTRLFKQGAFFSRPYGIWADLVYNGNARNTIVTQKVKEIFDPNNVMNPGKLCF